MRREEVAFGSVADLTFRFWHNKACTVFSHLGAQRAIVDPTIVSAVAVSATIKKAWDSLYTAYANKSQTLIFNLRDQLARLMKKARPVADSSCYSDPL
ncbi:hypothetical protein ACH5RR_026695 [Cinchona calisaya]|uniref:Uncharacterized protein n=1 Tax=Cinchona calisaya TaxID=153742 RepID=A0ABD2Z8A8_9GENT